MTGLGVRSRPWDRLVLCSRQQQALRAAALAATLVFLALVPLSGAAFHPVLSAVGLLLGIVVAVLPESGAPLVLLLYLGALWALVVPGPADLWTLGGAAALCVLHLACTLASYGPPGLRLGRRPLRIWAGRALVCVAAALLVWSAARVVASLDPPAAAGASAVALLLVLCWSGLLTARLAASHGRDPAGRGRGPAGSG